MGETAVLLHGFSGTHRAWDGVVARLDPERYRALALDLPGHGELAGAAGTVTFSGCVASVLQRAPERFALCGYSMGGRIAMHVALAAPERLKALILIACSPGIEDDQERAQRRESDASLAEQLEQEPFEDFIERWRSQPLFADEPQAAGELAREDQRRNDPKALAAALRNLGTGAMEPLWSKLPAIQTPTLIVVGDRDDKFVEIGQRMADLIPRAKLSVIQGGHGLPLENPEAAAKAIEQGLKPQPCVL